MNYQLLKAINQGNVLIPYNLLLSNENWYQLIQSGGLHFKTRWVITTFQKTPDRSRKKLSNEKFAFNHTDKLM